MSPLPAQGTFFVILGGDGGASHPAHVEGGRELVREVTKAGGAWGQKSMVRVGLRQGMGGRREEVEPNGTGWRRGLTGGEPH